MKSIFYSLAYYFWIVKKYIYISEVKFVVNKLNNNIILISEKRDGRKSGGAATERDHVEILKNIETCSNKKIIILYGFNSLVFYLSKYKYVRQDVLVVYYTHDLYYKRISNQTLMGFHKYLHIKLINKYVSLVWHCNVEEVKELTKMLCVKIFWIPALILKQKIKLKKVDLDNLNLIFIGSQEHGLNLMYIKRFVKTIYPELRKAFPAIKLDIVGIKQDRLSEFNLSKITCHGVVDDESLNYLMDNSNIGISPIPIYSGVNIKILEYLFDGLNVICHPSVNNTIKNLNECNQIKFAVDKDEWITSIKSLCSECSRSEKFYSDLEFSYGKENFIKSIGIH
jgi:hypothetical protein